MTTATPGRRLSGLAAGYCSYQEATGSFCERRELASTRNVLLLNLGGPIEIVDPQGQSVRIEEGEAFAAGVCVSTSLVRSEGRQCGLEISAAPEIMERILGVPLSELANRVVPVNDLDSPGLQESMRRLARSRSDQERFLACDRLVGQRLDQVDCFDEAASMVRRELQREAPPSVSVIAGQLGWSEKRVARRLKQHIGVSPRQLRRLARFERFWSRLTATGEGLADLALDAGYFDQPHLSREVKAFSGLTPSQLRRQVLPEGGGFLGG